MAGPERISFAELRAWQEVRGYPLDNVVVDMILRMDAAYMGEWHREREKPGGRQKAPPKRAPARPKRR